MASPRRRPIQRDNLDVEIVLKRAVTMAPEIEVGWSVLRQEMRDIGWPAHTPTDDRRPTTGNNNQEPACIDYTDPTGDLALRLEHLANDLDALHDHWQLVCTSLRAMSLIARRHMPPSAPAVPACSITTCNDHVEMTPGGGYRGMDQIAGTWVAKPGIRPLCAKHRSQQRRDPTTQHA
jgi:hypothetical protein